MRGAGRHRRGWRARIEAVIAPAPDVATAITAVCDELAAELVATRRQTITKARQRQPQEATA